MNENQVFGVPIMSVLTLVLGFMQGIKIRGFIIYKVYTEKHKVGHYIMTHS